MRLSCLEGRFVPKALGPFLSRAITAVTSFGQIIGQRVGMH